MKDSLGERIHMGVAWRANRGESLKEKGDGFR